MPKVLCERCDHLEVGTRLACWRGHHPTEDASEEIECDDYDEKPETEVENG